MLQKVFKGGKESVEFDPPIAQEEIDEVMRSARKIGKTVTYAVGDGRGHDRIVSAEEFREVVDEKLRRSTKPH